MSKFSEISSKDNNYLKFVDKLQTSAKARSEYNLFVLEGLRICRDAVDCGLSVEYTFVSSSFYEKTPEIAESFFEVSKLNYVVKDSLFLKICDTKSPQGIIVVAQKPSLNSKITENGRYVALDSVQDTANLGAIARTAEALGINGIIINEGCCDPYSPKSLRSSMGTVLRMPILFADNLPRYLNDNNLTAISFVLDDNAVPIDNIQYLQRDVIVIGNEANGVSTAVKDASRLLATIPMAGKVQSLNAASAAAIAIYDYTKKARL